MCRGADGCMDGDPVPEGARGPGEGGDARAAPDPAPAGRPAPQLQQPAPPKRARTAPGEVAHDGEASPELCHPLATGCRRVERFKKLNRIDEGTYGVVYRAQDNETGEVVALKQLKVNAAKSDDGFPFSSLREISILLKLSHPNIVRCREVVVGSSQQHIFMVMEYVEHELKTLLERHRFSVADTKCLLRQLLCGVMHLHERWVVHRDLKTSNILLNSGGVLKVCDFGLARHYGEPLRPYTQRVQSLWYRAPELLLGQKGYSTAVDAWSVGCVFAEILLRRPLLEGKVELHQLGLIFDLTGLPTEETWPGVERLPNWRLVEFKLSLPRWRAVFPPEGSLSDMGLEMLQSLLECCPARRVSAAVGHEHPYFWEMPYPQEIGMMATFQESNSEGRRARAATAAQCSAAAAASARLASSAAAATARLGAAALAKLQ